MGRRWSRLLPGRDRVGAKERPLLNAAVPLKERHIQEDGGVQEGVTVFSDTQSSRGLRSCTADSKFVQGEEDLVYDHTSQQKQMNSEQQIRN